MASIEGDLQTHTEEPNSCSDLAGLACGDGRLGAVEDEINEIIEELYAGNYPKAVLRVTREMPAATLVGIAAVEPRKGPLFDHLLIPADKNQDAAYVLVLALDKAYRGRKTSKYGTPLSEVLFIDVLRYLVETNGGAIPPVQAMIANANRPSRMLASKHGFRCPLQGIGASFYIRPRNHPLPVAAPST